MIAKLIDKDRPNTIIHEVGHLTVAMALGFPAQARIEPTETTDPVNEKTWVGSCTINYSFRKPTNREQTMIGLAGWLAVLLHEKPDADVFEELSALDLSRGTFAEGLSHTDLTSLTVNNRWIVKWAEEVQMILETHTVFLKWATGQLSERGHIPEHEAVAAFPNRRKFAKYRARIEETKRKLAEALSRHRQSSSDGCEPSS